jgi:hypothetical protein
MAGSRPSAGCDIPSLPFPSAGRPLFACLRRGAGAEGARAAAARPRLELLLLGPKPNSRPGRAFETPRPRVPWADPFPPREGAASFEATPSVHEREATTSSPCCLSPPPSLSAPPYDLTSPLGACRQRLFRPSSARRARHCHRCRAPPSLASAAAHPSSTPPRRPEPSLTEQQPFRRRRAWTSSPANSSSSSSTTVDRTTAATFRQVRPLLSSLPPGRRMIGAAPRSRSIGLGRPGGPVLFWTRCLGCLRAGRRQRAQGQRCSPP